jgi:hypothetical protein
MAGVAAEIRTKHLPTRSPVSDRYSNLFGLCSQYKPKGEDARGDGWEEGLEGCNHVSFRKMPLDVSEEDIASILRVEE